MNTPVPDCIVNFFARDLQTNTTDGKYVCLGTYTKRGFKDLNWKSKVLKDEHAPDSPEHHYVFVEIAEVVIHALGNSLDDCMFYDSQREEVLEYARAAGIEIPEGYLTKTSKRSVKKKLTQKKPKDASKVKPVKLAKPEHDPIDLYDGKIESIKQINLENPVQVRTPSGSKSLELLPGKYLFALIDSPLEHEKGNVQWLVLEDQLPVVYGKSVSTWQMILDLDPLSS
jgi:hypothetical protein